MGKTLTLFLTSPPYGYENTLTALRLAEAALAQGHHVNLFASADAVYGFYRQQRVVGLPNHVRGFANLIAAGLHVELCGSCLALRGIEKDDVLDGSEPSSMKRLFGLAEGSDTFITLGS